RLARRRLHRLLQLAVRAHDPQAASAAAGAGLDHDRIAGGAGEIERLLNGRDGAVGARDGRHAGLFRQLPRLHLAAHQMDRLWRRPDEADAGGLAQMRELCVLGKEAVARMDRVRADALREAHDLLHVEKALDRARPDEIGLVRFLDVNAGGILLGVDGGGRDAELAACADDAHRDLAAVGNQNLLKNHGACRPKRLAKLSYGGRGRRENYLPLMRTGFCALPPPATTITKLIPLRVSGTTASTVVSLT